MCAFYYGVLGEIEGTTRERGQIEANKRSMVVPEADRKIPGWRSRTYVA